VAPYPWISTKELEISLDQSETSQSLSSDVNRIEVTLHGPAPVTDAPATPSTPVGIMPGGAQ